MVGCVYGHPWKKDIEKGGNKNKINNGCYVAMKSEG